MVCAYVALFTGDMPQQQDNSGFKRQSAKKGCRYCLIDEKQRGDLDYDIFKNGRSHHHTTQLRKYAESLPTKKEFKEFCVKWGLAENLTPLVKMTPALDVIKSRPADPAHSEYAGMAKLCPTLLLKQRRSMQQSFVGSPSRLAGANSNRQFIT